ncbi:MAG: GNAT family N-acetyltransferase [Chlamydiia bacterium]|nr:GNAT family N-acetyltransferase [Chlamydiia bacterium]
MTLTPLNTSEYATVKLLFRGATINLPTLHSVLEGTSAGKIFVDQRQAPSMALVCNNAGYTFLAGDLNQNILAESVKLLKSFPRVTLVCPLKSSYRSFFIGEGFQPVERLQLTRPSHSIDMKSWIKKLPPQYKISSLDKELFPQCLWSEFIQKYCGTVDRFFAHSKGFCILEKGKVVSESYLLEAQGLGEVAVITDENHRGQNLGTIACVVALDSCYQRGIEPYWSCDADNLASVAIAKKLGFEENATYDFLKHSAP